jgi:23S rRNA U2552 (ribose-2'-O)-methylase RlmE/FtsJ
VLEQTNNLGVHCFMADGVRKNPSNHESPVFTIILFLLKKGFSVEGNENIQEILSKQLYLCQFLSALSVLRVGGNFVCKIFDIFTPFSVGLVYLLYLCFDRICIHKPVTSRPANSER